MKLNRLFFLPLIFLLTACLSPQVSQEQRSPDQTVNDSNRIKISFIGDILVHRALYEAVMNSKEKKFSRLWPAAIPYFQSADFSYGNLEGPVALGIDNSFKDRGDIGFVYDGSVYSGTGFSFNYHPNIINDIKASGIDLVSTSNNHTKDRGSIGIDRTIEAMNAKNMLFVGTRKRGDSQLSSFYRITPVKNIKVGWIACTEHLNGNSDKEAQVLLCYSQAQKIISLIQEMKNQQGADVVIVTPHWGEEYVLTPDASQKRHARLFLDAGADAIVGSHPHVLQPVEQYKTKDGRDTFIAYSLGNFVSGQARMERKASAIIFLEFEKYGDQTRIVNYNYQPTSFSGAALGNPNPQMLLATGMKETLAHIEKLLSRKLIPLSK